MTFKPTEEDRANVERMAGVGIQQDMIARVLGVTKPTLRKYFPDELEVGKAKTIAAVASSLVNQALSGNIGAAIFYLKAQAQWRDRDPEIGKKELAEAMAKRADTGSDWDRDLSRPARNPGGPGATIN